MSYVLYILKCEDRSLYTGITTDLKRRLRQHKNKKGGAYTQAHTAVKIVHTEQFLNRSAALKREAEIKGWRRERKLSLINGN
jgi:putative endonuclease